jgi:hypothetical protein
MSKNQDKLVPNGTDGTIPNHTVESPLTGDLAIDQQAKLVDTRTYREIFLAGMATGAFDACANCAQVNKAIADLKGNGKTCVYMVSEVAHAWERVNGKWIAKTEDWLKANPFVPGVGHTRENYKGRLSDDDCKALQAQQKALNTLTGDLAVSVAPLIKEIGERLANHETACKLEAIGQAAIKRRTLILDNVKVAMQTHEKAGYNYPLTLTLNHDGTVVQVVVVGLV